MLFFPSTETSLGLFGCSWKCLFLVKKLFCLLGLRYTQRQRLLLSAEATVKWKSINVVAWHASMGNTFNKKACHPKCFDSLFLWENKKAMESVNGKLDLYSNWHYFLQEQGKSFLLSLLLAVSLMWFSFLLLFCFSHSCCESCSSVAALL